MTFVLAYLKILCISIYSNMNFSTHCLVVTFFSQVFLIYGAIIFLYSGVLIFYFDPLSCKMKFTPKQQKIAKNQILILVYFLS